MKRIVYLFAFIGAVFTGCNPVEDINNDLDQGDVVVGVDEFTMTSDDYANVVEQDEDEDPDYYETFEAFSDVDDAKAMLPGFLTNRYPFWGEGSSVTVNYNLYDGNPEDVSAFTNADIYFLGSDDYITSNSNAFLLGEDIDMALQDILANQFTMPTEGQVVRFAYNQFTAEPEVGLASLYEASFPANFEGFELVEVLDDGLTGTDDNLGWRNQSSFAEGSGFSGGANSTEEWLISPEIDLAGDSGLFFQITQEIDLFGADPALIDIMISTDHITGSDIMYASWTPLAFDKTIYGNLTTSEDFDFSAYDGQSIHIALKYSSTDSESARWRVESFSVKTVGFSGDTDSLSSYYQYSEGSWEEIDGVYYLSSADYDSMGAPGQFNNFSGTVLPENYLPQFLSIEYPFAQEGDELFVIYKYYGGSAVGTVIKGNLYTFADGEWSSSIATLQLGFENGMWVPDNTIRYSLVGADYGTVATALLDVEGFETAAGNLDNFGNFNRTGGGSSWSDEMMVTAMGIVLDNLDPSAAEGQKYLVTADVYTGSGGTEDFRLIRSGGEWIAN